MLASAKPDSENTPRAAASRLARVACARPAPRPPTVAVLMPAPARAHSVTKTQAGKAGLRRAKRHCSRCDSSQASMLPHMPLYRLREAADLLGVSVDTVRRWA